jgi:hypothetical protein
MVMVSLSKNDEKVGFGQDLIAGAATSKAVLEAGAGNAKIVLWVELKR